MSHLGASFAATLAGILMTHFRLLCPLHGPCIVLLPFAAVNKTVFRTSSARTDCNHPSSTLWLLSGGLQLDGNTVFPLCVWSGHPNLTQAPVNGCVKESVCAGHAEGLKSDSNPNITFKQFCEG